MANPLPGPLRGAIFDLDGTLLDTLEDLADSMNVALEAHGLPTHDLASYRYFVGNGVQDLVRCTMPQELVNEPGLVDAVVARYRQAYAEGWQRKTTYYSGILPALDALCRLGVRLGVLSNKPQKFTEQVMAGYFSQRLFEPIFGQRDHVPRKPDPAGALEIASRWDMAVGEIAFIGDTDTDMRTANTADMVAIGVSWGFRPARELWDTGAKFVVDQPSEFLKFFS